MFLKSSSYIFNSILAYGFLMKSMLLKIKNSIEFLSVFTGQYCNNLEFFSYNSFKGNVKFIGKTAGPYMYNYNSLKHSHLVVIRHADHRVYNIRSYVKILSLVGF